MVSCFLSELGGGSNLETVFGIDVLCLFGLVKLLASLAEIPFHHVQESVILGLVDPGIFNDQAAIFSQGLGNLFAVGLGGRCFCEEPLDINDWNFDG